MHRQYDECGSVGIAPRVPMTTTRREPRHHPIKSRGGVLPGAPKLVAELQRFGEVVELAAVVVHAAVAA